MANFGKDRKKNKSQTEEPKQKKPNALEKLLASSKKSGLHKDLKKVEKSLE